MASTTIQKTGNKSRFQPKRKVVGRSRFNNDLAVSVDIQRVLALVQSCPDMRPLPLHLEEDRFMLLYIAIRIAERVVTPPNARRYLVYVSPEEGKIF